MIETAQAQLGSENYCIGWDVGGWNCDHNAASRDAIVIIDSTMAVIGTPWRGNLRQVINNACSSDDWIDSLFALCKLSAPYPSTRVVMGIDTPLGFSEQFANLITHRSVAGPVGGSATNPYLYRQTEQFLIRNGIQPLSAVKDMIGSQATKGMHVLAKFAPYVESCGVWNDGRRFQAIEAYPSACKNSTRIQGMVNGRSLGHQDKDDALKCALIAYLFANEPDALEQPPAGAPESEGWIWVPRLKQG